MRVRIVNDGKGKYNTHVYSVTTGEEMLYVTDASIHFHADEPVPWADITINLPVVDVVVDAHVKYKCPYCGYARYEDGKSEPPDETLLGWARDEG